jgi:hypothetical protein
MTQPTVQCSTAQEAQDFIEANASGGPVLVLAPEVLEQIQAAEAQGGFEGGMSGASGEGGFSAEGNAGPNASSGTEPPPLDIDLDGAVTSDEIARVVDGAVHLASGVAEAAHWVAERGLGPIVIVPMEELKKLAGISPPDGA